jgi:hypothetical protein
MEFVGREMIANFEESLENRVALFRVLQANALEMGMENTFRFEKHLFRNGRLIVDSFRWRWLMHRGLNCGAFFISITNL